MPSMMGYDIHDLTFERILASKAEKHGDKTFLTFMPDGRSFSYRDIDRQSNRIANGLLAHGITQGTHVAVLMENSPEHMLTYFALGKLGAVFVPLNTASRGEHLKYFVSHSDSEAVVVDEALLEQIEDIRSDLSAVRKLFVLPADGLRLTSGHAAAAGVTNFRDLENYPDTRTAVTTKFSELCSLMYTSGTTGPSKGNMFTQAHTLTFGLEPIKAQGFGSEDIYYVCLPLFHAAGWNMFTLGPLLCDGGVALTRRLSVTRFWEEVRESGATFANAAGVAQFLMAAPASPLDRSHKLRRFGTAPLPPDPSAFEERFGVRIVSGFGLTDYCHALAFTGEDDRSKFGSCGRPTPGVEVRIVDDDDFDVPAGTGGEILLRARNSWSSSLGYYKMPEATVAATRNLWFHTGDRGYMDKDGYVFFLDRKKDAIRRRGENISAFEVEQAVGSHPAVAQVAAFAVRAETTEDEIAITVVLRADAVIDESALVEYCERSMPKFMVPRFIEFRAELPRTMTLKIQKAKLREEANSDMGRFWDRMLGDRCKPAREREAG
jgi:carnitine-CoA ligase